MFFYLFSLVVCLTLTLAVAMVLTRCLTVNWERKNRHPFSYLLPVALTVVLLYVSLTLTVPTALDFVAIANDTLTVEEIAVDGSTLKRFSLVVHGRTLYVNPWQFKLEPGQVVRVAYTPRSRFILEVIEIVQDVPQS
ncbi:MAG: hypothetical protein GX821_09800 [Clostridiaceae bacterium]|nr:hypothetical protein [Eubacteriales bacterium]MDD4744550.1 hypothetical protein [Eubacteriales bacterium]NLB45440.1 hypothetical protein [Clostridiaceae bacterium]